MRSVGNQPLKQDTSDLLLEILVSRLGEEKQNHTRIEMSVVVRESQLIDDGVEKMVTRVRIECLTESLEDIHGTALSQLQLRSLHLLDRLHSYVQDQRVDERSVELTTGKDHRR